MTSKKFDFDTNVPEPTERDESIHDFLDDNEPIWSVEITSEIGMEVFAAQVSEWVKAGDLLTFSGQLGAGKTIFARALIRHLCQDPMLETPSPTFTLMQIYQGRDFPIVHADFYRISERNDLEEIGFDEAREDALTLVEWAENVGAPLHPDRLEIQFSCDIEREDTFRRLQLIGHGIFGKRVTRAKAVGKVLAQSGWMQARREYITGDASSRSYERLRSFKGDTAILMITPQRPPGPIIRFGKPYPAIARLALNIQPFLAMDVALRDQGFSAPEIYAADVQTGTAILEDLGDETIAPQGEPIEERYSAALSLLATMHNRNLPETIYHPYGEAYCIPPYDMEAMLIEVEQLLDWYAPHIAKISLSSSARAIFLNVWRKVIVDLGAFHATWSLRDYHSPNLLWLPERSETGKIGLIDFQDCVLGHPAYDVTSLLQDARVTIPDRFELKLLSIYAKLRSTGSSGFDMNDFARAYAIMGAQRTTKILGIFARLDKRDNKPHYLIHIPRVTRYLLKNLSHPVLSEVKIWFEMYMPSLLETPL